jgi:hypothetical protein
VNTMKGSSEGSMGRSGVSPSPEEYQAASGIPSRAGAACSRSCGQRPLVHAERPGLPFSNAQHDAGGRSGANDD